MLTLTEVERGVYKLWATECNHCGEVVVFKSIPPHQCFKCFRALPDIINIMKNKEDRIEYHYE